MLPDRSWLLADCLIGSISALGGCGGSTDAGRLELTDEQKATRAAEAKDTADSFKSFQTTKKKGAPAQKSRPVI